MFISPLRATAPAVSTHTSAKAAPHPDGGGTHLKSFVQVMSEGQQRASPGAHAGGPAGGAARTGPAAEGAPAGPDGRSGPGVRVLAERALDAEKRVDALIASAGKGRTFSAAELIALQATVFRYSQTVEVISRTADRLVGAIKQTLGTQV